MSCHISFPGSKRIDVRTFFLIPKKLFNGSSQFLIRNFHLVAENLNKGFLSAGSRLHKLFKLLPDFGYGFLPFISGGSGPSLSMSAQSI